jgi:hypothetical protein
MPSRLLRLRRLERTLSPERKTRYTVIVPLGDGYVMVNDETMTEAEWQERERERGECPTYHVRIPSVADQDTGEDL